jgi:hypothetical protein
VSFNQPKISRRSDFDAGKLLDLLGRKLHQAVTQGKQSVVYTHADALTGLHTRTTLAHEHTAGADKLTAKELNAEPLTL